MMELEPEWRMRLRNCWRYPFVLIDRRWPTDRHWRGGKWANVLRVLIYELACGCPPDFGGVLVLARHRPR